MGSAFMKRSEGIVQAYCSIPLHVWVGKGFNVLLPCGNKYRNTSHHTSPSIFLKGDLDID